VAFSWDGESEDNFDIYSKRIGTEPPHRLTHDAAVDTNPAWSPDGQNIAFLRASVPGRLSVVLIPSGGGPERTIGDVSRVEVMNRCLTWSPAGRWVVVYDRPPLQAGGLWLLSPKTGEKRRLTTAGTEHAPVEKSPAFAPHGRVLAFARNAARNSFDLYLLPLTRDLTPAGDPKLLLRTNKVVGGLAWTTDGRELIFSSGLPGNINLFRMPVSGSVRPTRLTEQGEILALSIAPRSNRLAFVQLRREIDIHRAELSRDSGQARRSLPLIASSRLDRFPRYSPDGKRIAFVSLRSGEWQLWVADENGMSPVQITSFEQTEVAYPTWSPDGRQIGFVSNAQGPYEAWVIDASGGRPRRIETGGKHLFGLTWSRNGQWFYFLSGTGGARQVWRVAASGGTPQQITHRGAYCDLAQSPDDKWLYYLGPTGVWSVPADGGEEREVFRYDINPSPIETNARGIYFVRNASNATGDGSLMFFRFPKGPITLVDGIKTSYGFSVSPDGRLLVYTNMKAGADLMMIPDFR
jgi:Tol biopolymer transport system component